MTEGVGVRRGNAAPLGEYFIILKDMDLSKSLCETGTMGLAEEAFDRLRRIAFEGEHIEKMAALVAQTELSPGVIKTLMRLSRSDGVSMGEMARSIGVDPSYITALVDDLADHGLAAREPGRIDRRVKMVVLTKKGRDLSEEIQSVLSVPPASFGALTRAELQQLRDLLDKVVEADPTFAAESGERPPASKAAAR
jgi:DNA-binding MarR family transcriptional regulator